MFESSRSGFTSPTGPSTPFLRTLVPKSIPGMVQPESLNGESFRAQRKEGSQLISSLSETCLYSPSPIVARLLPGDSHVVPLWVVYYNPEGTGRSQSGST